MSAVAKRPDDGSGPRAVAKTAKKAAPKKAAAKKAPAKKAAAKKAPAKVAVKKAPAKKAAVKKAAAKKAPAKKAAAKKAAPQSGKKSSAGSSRASGSTASRLELPAAPTDPYDVLGLRGPLTAATLRTAWREYAARHHPDSGGDPATFTRGRAAFETLRNEMGARP